MKNLARTCTFLLALGVAASCGGGGGGGGAIQISAQLSTVRAATHFGARADAGETVEIVVTVLDSNGDPLPGQSVLLEVEGVGASVLQPAGPTDVDGVAVGEVSSAVAGPKTLSATVNPGPGEVVLDERAATEFVRIPPRSHFVRAGGSDAASGAAPLEAWATLAFAVTQLTPGDTLYVGAGSWPGGLDLALAGTADAPIILRGDPTGLFTGDAGDVTIDAQGGPFALRLTGASHLVVRGFTLVGARPGAQDGAALRVDGGADLHLVENRIHGSDLGVHVTGAQRVHLEGNRVSANDGDGIVLEGTADATVRHDLVYGNAGHGIVLSGADGTTVDLVTLHRNEGDQLREAVAGSGGTIQNTIVSEGMAVGIHLAESSGLGLAGNLVWGNLGPEILVGSLVPPPSSSADPLFVDPDGPDDVLGGAGGADDDFRLQGGSPALDSGQSPASRLRLPFGGWLRGMASLADGTVEGTGSDGATANAGVHARPAAEPFLPLDGGEGRLVFAAGDDVRLQTRARSGSGAWKAVERTAPTNEAPRWIVHRASPRPSAEEFLAALTDDGATTELFVRHWDGRRWSEDDALRPLVDAVPSANAGQRGFDLELEAASGDALLVHSDGTSVPRYRTFADGEWSADAPVFPAPAGSGAVLWVELVPRPGTDEVALVTLDEGENLLALVWDGAAWIDSGVPTVLGTRIAELRESRAFDAAWESQSGDLLVAWGFNDVAEETRYGSRSAVTGSWTVLQHPSTDAVGAVVRLAADPTSDRIVGGFGEGLAGTDVTAMIWNGDAWTDGAEFVLGGPADRRDLGVGWIGTSGHAVLVFDADAATGVLDWARWRPSGWRTQTDVPLPGMGALAFTELRNRADGDLVALVVDDAGTLRSLVHDGVGWTVEGGGGAIASGLELVGATEPFDLSLRP